MSEAIDHKITQILGDWQGGDDDAKERLLGAVYDDLKRHARSLMSRERQNHTLQPTALVHEAFLKMGNATGVQWRDRKHFFGITSHLMRQILVDHARSHSTNKRGNRVIHFSTDDVDIPVDERADSILAIHEVLDKLWTMDKRQAQIVEMRFFGGMTNEEIAEAFDINERTVIREWQSARLWLYRELNQ